MNYGVGFPWPVSPVIGRTSYELINPNFDNSKGGYWRPSAPVPSPGRRNSVFSLNAPPIVSLVEHGLEGEEPANKEMPSTTPVVVSAQVSDPDGVSSVQLLYQVNRAGSFEPAELPLSPAILGLTPEAPRAINTQFSDQGMWSRLEMKDDGAGHDAVRGDGKYTASIPGQMHRALVRYRIQVRDGAQVPRSAMVPYADDPSRNFAYYVYDGVPDYNVQQTATGTTRIYPATELTQLPVYHFLTRNSDLRACLAHDRGSQLAEASAGRAVHNWEGAFVYRGKVYDHVRYRLRGSDRYQGRGKRDMSIRFNEGQFFQAPPGMGARADVPWGELLVSKQSTSQGGDFGLAETINSRFWQANGVPAQDTHWFHLRVVDAVDEGAAQFSGDFWGLFLALEPYDGGFLQRHGVRDGNLFHHDGEGTKLVNEATGAPANGNDLKNIHDHLIPGQDEQWIRDHVDVEKWARWSAVKEAVQHHAFPSLASYFEPDYRFANGRHGQLWVLPGSAPNSWVPLEEESSKERVGMAVENLEVLRRIERNAVREFRDLFWQRDQIEALFEELFLEIASIQPADRDRWANASSGEGLEDWGTLEAKIEAMRIFAFGEGEGPGGSAEHLDDYVLDSFIPERPFVRYNGEADNYPFEIEAGEAQFVATGYHHPAGTPFDVISWRLAEVGVDERGEQHYEWDAQWESEPLATNETKMTIPVTELVAGRSYRIRVRYRDVLGRWSHWSQPEEFSILREGVVALERDLRITEIMFHPAAAGTAERALGFQTSDFAFVELQNVGGGALDLRNVHLEGAVQFSFEGASISVLAPGASLLVVADGKGFERRYGPGHPVAGEWVPGGGFYPQGDLLQLTHGWGLPVHGVAFESASPWPVGESDEGYSLTLRQPRNGSAPDDPQSWRVSRLRGGSPGTSDSLQLVEWLAAHRLLGAFDDEDGDGDANLLEHAMGTDPRDPGERVVPDVEEERDHIAFSYTLAAAADSVDLVFEISHDLLTWREIDFADGSRVNQGGGTVKVTMRVDRAALDSEAAFVRVRAQLVP